MFGFREYDVLQDNHTYEVTGTIISEPENKYTYWRYSFNIDTVISHTDTSKPAHPNADTRSSTVLNQKINSIILAKEKKFERSHVAYGQRVRAIVHIKKPQNIESERGAVFDYKKFLEKDGVLFIGDTRVLDTIKEPSFSVQNILYRFKHSFIEHVEKALPAPHSFLATGLVISGKGSMSRELQEQFQKVGLIHIVVLSGSNISIIGEAIYTAFFFLPTLVRIVASGLSIILFGMMTGGGATVVRSVIMALIGLYMKLTQRKNNALISLTLAGGLMVFYNPNILFHDPSFQLSFLATLGLIFLSSPIEICIKKTCPYVPHSVVSLTSTSLATQIFTLPLIISFSGIVSLISLPVNLLVLPLIPSTMFFVFLTGVISFIIPSIVFIPAFVSWLLLSTELYLVKFAAGLPVSHVLLPPVSKEFIVSLTIVIICLTYVLNIYSQKGSVKKVNVVYKTNTTPV